MKYSVLAMAFVLAGCSAVNPQPAAVVSEYDSCKIYYESPKPPVANVTVVRHKKKPRKEKTDGQQ